MNTREEMHQVAGLRCGTRTGRLATRALGLDWPAAEIVDSATSRVTLVPVSQSQLESAKRAYTTRRCDFGDVRYLLTAGTAPQAGDVVLARVEEIGQHSGLHAVSGRRSTLFVGDEIIVAFGNRYAPDQFEAVVPTDLGPCQLAAGGGVAARVVASHVKMRKATQLRPLGLLADANGRPLNLQHYSLPCVEGRPRRPVTIAVVGTSMNSGKTTTAAHLVRGLRAAGLAVSAAKVTGTGAGGDPWLMRDAGAAQVLDFTDAGHASTYKLPLETLCDCIDRVVRCCRGDLRAGNRRRSRRERLRCLCLLHRRHERRRQRSG